MNDAAVAATPEISVVLATDSWQAVRQAFEAFGRQSAAGRLEVLLVAPRAELERVDLGGAGALAVVHRVEAESPFELSRARAQGARAASAPRVFVGETHSFAEPTLAAELLAALEQAPRGEVPPALVPCIYNVNPTGAVSWASFLIDYGA